MTGQKLSWNPCGICDQPDGPVQSPRHLSPARFRVTEELFFAMNEHEQAALKAAHDKTICATCRNRLYMRAFRDGRRSEGLPTRRPLMREWEP